MLVHFRGIIFGVADHVGVCAVLQKLPPCVGSHFSTSRVSSCPAGKDQSHHRARWSRSLKNGGHASLSWDDQPSVFVKEEDTHGLCLYRRQSPANDAIYFQGFGDPLRMSQEHRSAPFK